MLNIYILLDRTGSMGSRWEEAISAVNSYINGLAEEEANVTLALFDRPNGTLSFDVLRRNEPAQNWRAVSNTEAHPRGMTPLYDAIGRLSAIVEADSPEQAVIVVMTDGEENASREMSREQARAALDRCRDRNWQVVFLGADFDAFNEASKVGTMAGQTLNASGGNYAAAAESLTAHSRAHAHDMNYNITWTDEDRRRATGGDDD